MSQPRHVHVALVGTTASGKSALAMDIARKMPEFELVSVDSMQVYKGMDIGTAKPSKDERAEVRHHLIDLVEPSEDFTLSQFQSAAKQAIADIEFRGKRVLLVGGTGLYLQAITDDLELPGQFPEVAAELQTTADTRVLHQKLTELDDVTAARTDPDNRRRIVRALEVTIGSGRPFSSYGPGIGAFQESRFDMLGVWLPRAVNSQRIENRVNDMLNNGWAEEIAQLTSEGEMSKTAAQALGYKELLAQEMGMDLKVVAGDITRRTRSFARRQRMWFRRDPRIHWFGSTGESRSLLPALLAHLERIERSAEKADRETLRLEGGDST